MAQEGTSLIPDIMPDGASVLEAIHSEPCKAVARTLALIGSKWSVLIIMLLSEKPYRFNELKRAIGGISQRMLTLTLRDLEHEGLVSRSVIEVMPPRVEYALTELGVTLKAPITALGLWAIQNQPALRAARREATARDKAA